MQRTLTRPRDARIRSSVAAALGVSRLRARARGADATRRPGRRRAPAPRASPRRSPIAKDVARSSARSPRAMSLIVDGDEDLLHRAVFNLVLNAVQASPNGGEVHVDVTRGVVRSASASASPSTHGTVALRVRDAGPGIPAEIRDRLFDPFFTTKPGGSGLGLAVVHRAIEAHRGLVFVDSGAAARASPSFFPARNRSGLAPWKRPRPPSRSSAPLTPRERLVTASTSASPPSSSSTTNRAFSTRSTSCCATKASRPALAQGGKRGLEQLIALTPDIVLTDIRMPNVTRRGDPRRRASSATPTCPVILMTAQATLQSAMQAVNEGAFYYIQKPFRNDELVAILRRAAEHRKLRVENKSLKQAIRRRERHGVVASRRHAARRGSRCCASPRRSRRRNPRCSSRASRERVRKSSRATSTICPTRVEGPFLSINCGALPESLLESELFGHVKGSFTGAVKDKERSLHARRPRARSSSTKSARRRRRRRSSCCACCSIAKSFPSAPPRRIPIDTRLIAATNRDLEEEIRRGQLPQRSLLPPERHRAAPAAAAPARATTSRCSPSTFCSASPSTRSEAPKTLAARRARGAAGVSRGPVTCASWRTRSSAP